MNWSELSSRERDALVAEKVMRYEDNRPTGRPDEMYGINDYTDQGPIWILDVPNYTTDIKAAWDMVELFEDETSICSHPGGGWKVSFIWNDSNPYSNECVEWSYGDTAPEAICLAALRAVGVEIG